MLVHLTSVYFPFALALTHADRNPDGVTATAVAALKGGKVVGIVVTNGGSGYSEVSSIVPARR